ncbi:hypothetical protein BDV93DRAFT_504798 [Ceratobasidium sp. AG-I]|nr:hypothetical protein BDV93DRAFT_504798 [Ceratobasidium sp. AG-I]
MTAHSSPDIDELSAHSAEDQCPTITPPSPQNDQSESQEQAPSPPYPVESTPAYTPRPHTAERTVTRGPPTAAELTGTLEFAAKRFRVIFGAQVEGRSVREGVEYARGGKVRGLVVVGERWRGKVGCVELKIVGSIKLSIHDSGSTNTVFLSHTIPLHPAPSSPSSSSTSSPCPETLPFKWSLPQTYVDKWGSPPSNRVRPLPPSYELTIEGVPGLRARVRYEVEVVIRWKWKGLVGRKESLTTPFNYVPYAPHPHHAHSSVISTLKSCPGEWACYTERVPTRGPDVGEITSSLVLPTPPLHPLSQPIPFHFQLSAECPPALSSTSSSTNLRRHRLSISSITSHHQHPHTSKFITTSKPSPNAAAAGTTQQTPSIPIALLAEPALLRLSIQRQISVDVRGARALRVMSGGEGRMERVLLGAGGRSVGGRRGVEVLYEGQVLDGPSSSSGPASGVGAGGSGGVGAGPPAYASLRRTGSLRSILSHMSGGRSDAGAGAGGGVSVPVGVERVRDREGGGECFAIAWEGSVTPEREVLRVGGFRAGGLLIKDFVTLTLVPPTPELSPLRALQQAVPVRCIVVNEAEMQASMSGGW